MHDLHSILLKIPDVLSTSSDNEVEINLKLSIILSLFVIFLPLSHFFLDWYRKNDIFFILSPIQLSWPLNSFANWSIIK